MNIPKKQTIFFVVLTLASCLAAWAYFSSRSVTSKKEKTYPEIPVLTEEHAIDTLRTKHKVLFIFVHMQQCGPCKYLSPKINQLASENQNQNVHFVKIERENAPNFCEEHDIKVFPTVLLFKKGRLVKHFAGCSQGSVNFFAQEIEALT